MRLLIVAAIALVSAAPARGDGEPIRIGERLTLPSKILGESRTVYVSLPESYARGGQRYPVLYLTDAQWQFEHTRATAAFLARNQLAPEVIVVGVANTDRTRDLYATRADFKYNGRTIPFPTSGQADRFLEFIAKELIPWAEARYRTLPLRILAGVSAGGNFALHAMRTRPGLFQAIVAASPWLAWDDERELKELVPFLSHADVKVRSLFFSSANEGPEMQANVDALAAVLHARKDPSLRWRQAAYADETHETTVLKSYFDGLRMIFADWSPPRDATTNDLVGTLVDIKAHYVKLGEQLGCAFLPPEGIVNELGYRDLKRKDIAAAIAAFRYGASLYPQSANVWDSLADALEAAGRLSEALASCRKAVALGEANGDANVEHFRKHLARVAQALPVRQ